VANAEHVARVRSGAEATWSVRHERLDLRDADLSGVRLRGAMLDHADLRGARLVGADFTGTRLQESNLAGAQLIRATCDDVRMGGSSLANALLCSASFRRAILVRCDLTHANLAGADLESARLTHARLAGAVLNRTKLVDAVLHDVSGLDQVNHQGPSELGTQALLRFGNEMPTSFLRGVGLSDGLIRYLPAIIASSRPIDFCSVFICAASCDAELATRLHNDLQAASVRCWFRRPSPDFADMDSVIHLYERSIVLCSERSLNDPLVQAELLASRRDGNRNVLLRLDNASMELTPGTLICDFREWQNFRSYVAAIDALLQVLNGGDGR
jgi:uncharacterized protein YjbI with pentapeptide repeats